MAFTRSYPIQFRDTDAAGVLYFANGLALCHAAYEDSLQSAGFDLRDFFSASARLAYPIVHASMDYHRPLHCGDLVRITLHPRRLDAFSFEITYHLALNAEVDAEPESKANRPLAEALTRHTCIETQPRRRHPLPTGMEQWLHRWESPDQGSDQ
ncbi:putative thioesterase [Leptolyngbya sp. BL0902]|uniref:acyl-CoA thioesterase n=1 Tax=Leptolyngbya sp. BL0902 TaxID=1115757 RepID=UPI0018E7580F|nr:thioesterase family protein [Leptolyngbya sp. BL0902]QQE66245.1 putative thioesterase [Leptolyngbya sp. BL0902]